MTVSNLPLSSLKRQSEFYIIDIRGTQAFRAGHLGDSLHLQSKEEILDFVESNRKKEILLVCFSSTKARAMALALSKEARFRSLYTHKNLYFLECGIMEAFDSGLEVCSDFLSTNFIESKNAKSSLDSTNSAESALLNQGDFMLDSIKISDSTLDSAILKGDYTSSPPPITRKLHDINSLDKAQNLSQDKSKSTQIPQSADSSHFITHTISDLRRRYLASKKAWVVTFSGGKDSTCVLQLVYEMLLSLPPHLRRPTFAIASNTLVEAPHIDRFLHSVIDSINAHARAKTTKVYTTEIALRRTQYDIKRR